MKKTLHIDERLLRDAKSVSGAKTDTDTVRLGLEALVRRGAYERLQATATEWAHFKDMQMEITREMLAELREEIRAAIESLKLRDHEFENATPAA